VNRKYRVLAGEFLDWGRTDTKEISGKSAPFYCKFRVTFATSSLR
jgi:hypothetical protein